MTPNAYPTTNSASNLSCPDYTQTLVLTESQTISSSAAGATGTTDYGFEVTFTTPKYRAFNLVATYAATPWSTTPVSTSFNVIICKMPEWSGGVEFSTSSTTLVREEISGVQTWVFDVNASSAVDWTINLI